MKVTVYLVTYDGKERKEEQWEAIGEERRKVLAEKLTGKFMQAAGYSAAPG